MPYHDDERRRTGPFGYPLNDPAATQGTTPPAIADPGQRAEYIELNAQIAGAESKVAADEALADSQERDLRREGVTQYEAARFTGKLSEEARTAKFNIANLKAQQAVIEPAMKPTPPPPAGGAKTKTVGGSRWRLTVPDDAGSSPFEKAAYGATGQADGSSGATTGQAPVVRTPPRPRAKPVLGYPSGMGEPRILPDVMGAVLDLPATPDGETDESRFVWGQYYRMPGGGIERWTGREFVPRTQPPPNPPDYAYPEPGKVYRAKDGTPFLYDAGTRTYREARALDEPDEAGRRFAPMPDPGSVPTAGHPGAPETPGQIVANVARLGEQSGRGFTMDRRRLETLANQANGVQRQLDIARRIDPEGRNPRTGRLQAQHNQLMAEMRRAYGAAIKAAAPETVTTGAMAERMDWPGRAGHAAGKYVRGAANVGADVMKGLATGPGSYKYDELRALEAISRDGDIRNVDLSKFKESDRRKFALFFSASPEERSRMKQELIAGINAVPESLLYRGVEGLADSAKQAFPLNPNFEEDFFTSKLPEGLGRVTAYGGGALAGNVVGVGGAAATAFVASQEQAGQMFEDALKHGASLEQAFRARDLGQMLGLIEAIPIVPLLNKLTPEARSTVLRTFMQAMKSGTDSGVKEAWITLGDNLIASKLVTYDPEREAYEGVIDGAKVSFTASSILQAIGAAIAKR